MKRFVRQLQSVEARLDLPQPLKARILLEIAADMEDLFIHYTESGLDTEEATSRVEEKMDITDESLQALIQVHKSGFQKLLDQVELETRSRWEKIILVFTILIVAALSMRTVIAIPMITRASHFVWPILGIGLIGLIVFIAKAYHLYIRKDHEIRTLRKGIPSLLFFAGVSFVVGILGYFLELFKAGDHGYLMDYKIIFILTPHRMGSDVDLERLTTWMMQSSSMIMVSILVTISMAILWFILVNKVQKIERITAEWLLLE